MDIKSEFKAIMLMVNELENLIGENHKEVMFEQKRTQELLKTVQLSLTEELVDVHGVEELDEEREREAINDREESYLETIAGV